MKVETQSVNFNADQKLIDFIQKRMDKADREFPLAHKYDYIVVNDEVTNAADRILAIIRAEHAKTERSIYKYKEMLEVK